MVQEHRTLFKQKSFLCIVNFLIQPEAKAVIFGSELTLHYFFTDILVLGSLKPPGLSLINFNYFFLAFFEL